MAGNDDLRLRQICLVAPDLPKAEADISAVVGSPPCYRDPSVARYGLENALFPVGDNLLEVVVPTRGGTAAGRLLARFGARGGYMVIMDCSDVGRRRKHVEDLGIRIVNTLHYDGYHGIQLHPRDCRAAILEFNNTAGGELTTGPYHPAGPDWPNVAKLPFKARLISAEVETPDPGELAAHWARILEVPVEAGEPPCIRLKEASIVFVACAEEALERLIGLHIAVPDPDRTTRAARDRGLVAGDGSLWLCGVRIGLQPLMLDASP
jgi:hypothetical protein